MQNWQVWLIVAVILAIAEIFTAGFFIIWFAVGAGVAVLVDLIGLPVYVQISVFLLVSLILVLTTRPIIRRFQKEGRDLKTNYEALSGREGWVTEEIKPNGGIGQVRIDGQIWSAVAEDGSAIASGEKVIIVRVEGVKLVVKK